MCRLQSAVSSAFNDKVFLHAPLAYKLFHNGVVNIYQMLSSDTIANIRLSVMLNKFMCCQVFGFIFIHQAVSSFRQT